MPAAIDANRLTGDEVGLAKQDHRLGDFRLSAPVTNRRRLGYLVHLFLAHVGRRHDRAGCDRVHEDVVARDLERQRFGESDLRPTNRDKRARGFIPRAANSCATMRPIRFPPVMTPTFPQRSMAASMTGARSRFYWRAALKPQRGLDIQWLRQADHARAGLGHVSEITDAEAPFAPKGCPFQAWSLGELLRLDRVVLSAPKRAIQDRKADPQWV